MRDLLRDALDRSSQMLDAALSDAHNELAVLDARRSELTAMIEQAEAMRRPPTDPIPHGSKPLTLHEALIVILKENDNRWMTVRELATAVNDRGLYRKKDGSHVEPNQVHARTKNYEQLFEKNGPNVRMHPEVLARREAEND